MPKLPGRCCSLSHLGVDANGGLAEDTLVELHTETRQHTPASHTRSARRTHNGQDTAASALANGRADHAKVIGGSGDRGGWVETRVLVDATWKGDENQTEMDEKRKGTLTLSAVEISSTEDVGGAALGRPVEAAAGDIDRLALVEGGGEGGGEAGEEGDGGDGELHFGC